MSHCSHARGNVSRDLFNLPSLPDERKTTTMYNNFPNDFYLPDGKNFRISHIVNKWVFGRQTLGSNEGFGVEMSYLEHTYGTRHYVVDKITGNISAIYQDNVKPTDFFGNFGPFDLKELEFKVCRMADCHNGEDDFRLEDDRRRITPNIPAPLQ